MQPVGPYVGVEVAYRRERIAAEYAKAARRRHHPIRTLGKAISHAHERLSVL